MRNRSLIMLGVILVGIALIGQGIFLPVFAAEKKHVVFGGGTTGGAYFIISVGLSSIFEKYNPDIICTAQVTSGSTENIKGFDTGKIQISLTAGKYCYQAWDGISANFEDKKRKNIRYVMTGCESLYWIITKASSGIKSISDFKGHKIGIQIGPNNPDTWPAWQGYFGLNSEDYELVAYGVAELLNALEDGVVDAALGAGPLPNTACSQYLYSHPDSIFIPWSEEGVKSIHERYPQYLFSSVIPGGTYMGFPDDVPTVASQNWVVTTEDVDPDIIYRFTKTIFEHSDELKSIHPLAPQFNFENSAKTLKNLFLPVHPGALKYYKEKGIL